MASIERSAARRRYRLIRDLYWFEGSRSDPNAMPAWTPALPVAVVAGFLSEQDDPRVGAAPEDEETGKRRPPQSSPASSSGVSNRLLKYLSGQLRKSRVSW